VAELSVAELIPADASARSAPRSAGHAILSLVVRRALLGIVTLFIVSIVVFAATQVIPGNAAYAVLGQRATPVQLHQLEHQLGLNHSAASQYWTWFTGLLQGHFGKSLTSRESVGSLIGPRIVNSAALVVLAGLVGTATGVGLGLLAALRRDSWIDHILSVAALAVTALPEFVIGVGLILLLATNVFHLLPGVSSLTPGLEPWQQFKLLILPTVTLVIIIVPYIFRMMRAATIEALESDYVEMAQLKGLRARAVLVRHAFPNAIAPTIQAVGLSLLYLAGGIVVVEVVFNYPGLGLALYNAVLDKDIPTIQFIVMFLALFYISVNIGTDTIALISSPRRRMPR
jgi:peptide/nickel transport system permease protein